MQKKNFAPDKKDKDTGALGSASYLQTSKSFLCAASLLNRNDKERTNVQVLVYFF